jgi:hypothetical protein
MHLTPDERARRLASYGNGHQLLTAAIARYPREMWQYRALHDPWTIHEIIIHVADSEANSYVRCRRFIAEPGSMVIGYAEAVWAKALHYHDQSTEEAVDLFRALRRNSYHLIKDLPESAWTATVEHTENGTMTFDDWLITYDDHVIDHVKQMDAIYQAWKSATA